MVCGFNRTNNGDTRSYFLANPTIDGKTAVFSMDALPFKQALISGTIRVHEGPSILDSQEQTEKVLLKNFFDSPEPHLPRLRLNEVIAREMWLDKLGGTADKLITDQGGHERQDTRVLQKPGDTQVLPKPGDNQVLPQVTGDNQLLPKPDQVLPKMRPRRQRQAASKTAPEKTVVRDRKRAKQTRSDSTKKRKPSSTRNTRSQALNCDSFEEEKEDQPPRRRGRPKRSPIPHDVPLPNLQSKQSETFETPQWAIHLLEAVKLQIHQQFEAVKGVPPAVVTNQTPKHDLPISAPEAPLREESKTPTAQLQPSVSACSQFNSLTQPHIAGPPFLSWQIPAQPQQSMSQLRTIPLTQMIPLRVPQLLQQTPPALNHNQFGPFSFSHPLPLAQSVVLPQGTFGWPQNWI
eukprot:c52457_g1_i1.p1 GENE.c52457_g1_i1~~c52457_g1_i1.p1  ORF type:complete len:405 (-),score=55.43 c52457_g1_i1:20-1234(-)